MLSSLHGNYDGNSPKNSSGDESKRILWLANEIPYLEAKNFWKITGIATESADSSQFKQWVISD